jgi:hypothetical protein
MRATRADAARDDRALARVREIATELRDLEQRAGQVGSTDIEMSLFERAAELADEAARLLEDTGRASSSPGPASSSSGPESSSSGPAS